MCTPYSALVLVKFAVEVDATGAVPLHPKNLRLVGQFLSDRGQFARFDQLVSSWKPFVLKKPSKIYNFSAPKLPYVPMAIWESCEA